jgi:hypothetical protein
VHILLFIIIIVVVVVVALAMRIAVQQLHARLQALNLVALCT